MKHNSVTISPVRSLEVGDLIAFSGSVIISGRITGIVNSPYDLTPEQRIYMEKRGLRIPVRENDPISSGPTMLIFGEFSNHPSHIYLDYDANVAVFPNTVSTPSPT